MTIIELDLQTDHVVPERFSRGGVRLPAAMAVAVLLALSTVSGAEARPKRNVWPLSPAYDAGSRVQARLLFSER